MLNDGFEELDDICLRCIASVFRFPSATGQLERISITWYHLRDPRPHYSQGISSAFRVWRTEMVCEWRLDHCWQILNHPCTQDCLSMSCRTMNPQNLCRSKGEVIRYPVKKRLSIQDPVACTVKPPLNEVVVYIVCPTRTEPNVQFFPCFVFTC